MATSEKPSYDWQKHRPAPYPKPATRKLRAYAFDPQSSTDLATANINNAVISLPWEQPWEHPVTPGPCGEYIEVIDHDPASGLFYDPVDLNDPALLQEGLPASEGRPQFHQQMVYAVAMKTVRSFERALGRTIYWARELPPPTRTETVEARAEKRTEVVQRLRIYPHALRERNAYYSPDKTAILFGYFQPQDVQMGDRWVFTCLSQDIIAHETTHALLHGVHRRSVQRSNLDTLAFHEGFADIVALLQHFTMVDVLRQQIAQNAGSLRTTSLLNSLAGQFGKALGRRSGALRTALDLVQQDAQAAANASPEERARRTAATTLTDRVREAHDRGGFLVAAVFDAFVTIYERRTADLMRLARDGGLRSGDDLSPDLVGRLASEAAKIADHVLRMCVRALDYVPPVDMTFGEYLRAIITADTDLVPEDPFCYRVAFAQAFRRRGIVPEGSLSMSPDSLVWNRPDSNDLPTGQQGRGLFTNLLERLVFDNSFGQMKDEDGRPIDFSKPGGNFREINARVVRTNQINAHRWLNIDSEEDHLWERLLGVKLQSTGQLKARGERPLETVHWRTRRKDGEREPLVQIYSARVARRSGPDGQELNQLVLQVVQKRDGYFDPARQARADRGEPVEGRPDFWFRGGSTLLIDLRDGQLRHSVRKSIQTEDDARLHRQRQFEMGRDGRPELLYPHSGPQLDKEPFAMIHRG
ncbi:hypothetical protein [Sphingomonas quercus]|uniref:Uncharacterized protein n=1 Tax=Sphingomonas quercus TaxID=2842451 RepID=A0ABS6BI17_9SPHN|nr:hypothetical protein [Sphingomonas quercus]MBU3077955.1 hypothetical protein [Sphingomonas quercus]